MDQSYTRQMAEIQSRHWWYEGRRRILSALVQHYCHPAPSSCHSERSEGSQRRHRDPSTPALQDDKTEINNHYEIFEAGCGPGANLDMLQKFGTVSALEPDEFSCHFAREKTGLKIKQAFLPDIPFDQDFNLICAFDVIEHIDDDVEALKALYTKTKPGGMGIFTVPAHPWLWSHHDEINHHKRRYTRASFKKTLEESGYEIVKLSYYNMWLFPAAACVRVLKKALQTRDQGDMALPSAVMNGILRRVFTSEKYLLPRINLPFGMSLIAVCKKL